MIEDLIASYQYYVTQFITWYQTADILTQYVTIIVSGMIVFLLSTIMILSKITK